MLGYNEQMGLPREIIALQTQIELGTGLFFLSFRENNSVLKHKG